MHVVNNGSIALGWLEFTKNNLIQTNDRILVRHNGDLKYDPMLFEELKMSTKFPWTVPLSDILKLHVPGSNGMLCSNPFLPNSKRFATVISHKFYCLSFIPDKKAKYILYQHVCSSIKPNIAQDEADSIAFYQVYNKKNRDKFVSLCARSFYPFLI